MRCAVTADLARHERVVDRNDAYEAAVEEFEAGIYGDEDHLNDVVSSAAQAALKSRSGLSLAGLDFRSADRALAELAIRLRELRGIKCWDAVEHDADPLLIDAVNWAVEFVESAVREAAEGEVAA